MTAQKFRKKPVVIDAVKVDDVLYDAARNWKGLPDWIVEAYEHGDQAGAGSVVFARDGVHITTLEGTMVGDRGRGRRSSCSRPSPSCPSRRGPRSIWRSRTLRIGPFSCPCWARGVMC